MESTIEKLREDLTKGIVELNFIKTNGEARTIYASMSVDYLPKPKATKNPEMARPIPPENVIFWDMDALHFKSCKWENVIGWKSE